MIFRYPLHVRQHWTSQDLWRGNLQRSWAAELACHSHIIIIIIIIAAAICPLLALAAFGQVNPGIIKERADLLCTLAELADVGHTRRERSTIGMMIGWHPEFYRNNDLENLKDYVLQTVRDLTGI